MPLLDAAQFLRRQGARQPLHHRGRGSEHEGQHAQRGTLPLEVLAPLQGIGQQQGREHHRTGQEGRGALAPRLHRQDQPRNHPCSTDHGQPLQGRQPRRDDRHGRDQHHGQRHGTRGQQGLRHTNAQLTRKELTQEQQHQRPAQEPGEVLDAPVRGHRPLQAQALQQAFVGEAGIDHGTPAVQAEPQSAHLAAPHQVEHQCQRPQQAEAAHQAEVDRQVAPAVETHRGFVTQDGCMHHAALGMLEVRQVHDDVHRAGEGRQRQQARAEHGPLLQRRLSRLALRMNLLAVDIPARCAVLGDGQQRQPVGAVACQRQLIAAPTGGAAGRVVPGRRYLDRLGLRARGRIRGEEGARVPAPLAGQRDGALGEVPAANIQGAVHGTRRLDSNRRERRRRCQRQPEQQDKAAAESGSHDRSTG